MITPKKDRERAISAAKAIIDGRDPAADLGGILVTLEHLVALVLILSMKNDPRKAVAMLHEGLIPGVENRIALYASEARDA